MLIRQTTLLALMAMLYLCSCGGGPAGQPDAAEHNLPQPLAGDDSSGLDSLLPALDTLRAASGSQYPYVQAGVAALPEPWRNNSVPGDMDAFEFTPAYDSSQPQGDLSGLAWAVYAIDEVELNAGSDSLFLGWLDSIPEASDIWVGIADFQQQRWHVRRGPVPGKRLSLSDSAGMLSPDGLLYIAVLLTGQTEGNLQYIIYGDPLVELQLNAEPDQGLGQLATTLTAQAYMAGTTVLSYDFDVHGDGDFEVIGDADGVLQVNYELPDLYHPAVRVSFDYNVEAEASCPVHVINPSNTPPTAELSPEISFGAAPLLVNFDAGGSSDFEGAIQLYEWDLDGDGQFERSTQSPLMSLNYGIKGTTNVTVRVTDKDLATDTAEVSVMLSSGWDSELLDPSAGGYHLDADVSGGFLNPIPFVTYMDMASDELRCVRALDSQASTWSSVQLVDKRDGTGINPSACSIAGEPAVAYAVENSSVFDLYFQQANDASTWKAPKLVAAGGGIDQSLTQSNGKPLIAARSYATHDVASHTPSSDDFSTWESQLIMAGDQNEGPRLSFMDFIFSATTPGVIIGCDLPASMNISMAADSTAQSWSSVAQLLDVDPEALSAQNVGGAPTFAYIDNEDDGKLYYMHAPGSDPLQWNEAVLVDDSGRKDNQVGLASTVNGPALCWVDMEHEYLMYSAGSDAAGSSWSTPMVVAPIPGYAVQADIVPTISGAVIFYESSKDGEPYKLYAAVLQ